MSNNNEQKPDLVFRLESLESQIKVLGEAVSKLQKDCQWYRKKITQLEGQLAGYQMRGSEKRNVGSGKCNGLGYLRGGAQRDRCTIKGEFACTNCGECGKHINK
ncbi:hypothetical protein [Desulfoscipio gibsoniae]|uniref:Uncharacterized protein n=1 Tax=Desulfoscipio gibsoniae DSM 7213 TaxID=767817 RepID=R4KFX8_9FIRM|nr:hypothetical protein [Desulfoscipio gibsoniae]AGL02113.1 hypothetical protein Desgi_2709 [Desulfoscipio gibsoniae DSM 7213]